MRGAWLFLDIGNVLLDVDRDRSRRLFARLTGLDPEEFDWVFFDSGLLDLFNTGRISEEGFLHRVRGDVRHHGADLTDDQIRDVWDAMLIPVAAVADWVTEIEPELEGIWIVSDINPFHWRATEALLARQPLARLRGATLSYEVGFTKPAPAFFEDALRRSGARPDRVIYVDDRTINLEGARKVGIDGTLFDRLDYVRDKVARRLKGR
jgi:putative hydrolase of the HAD superfamily